MKLLNVLLFIVLSFPAIAEENALERALYDHWDYCWGAIAGEYELKGLDLRQDASVLEKSEVELREKFFSVPQDAIKEFVIGADGQVMHVIYRENLICAGETMNMYCGSGGCSRDFVINHDIYEIFGGKPSLVYANGRPVILVGRSGANCNTGPNSAACFQAFVWDESTQKFNTFGGHKKPVR